MNLSPPVHLYSALAIACRATGSYPDGVTFTEKQPVSLPVPDAATAQKYARMLRDAAWFCKGSDNHLLNTLARLMEIQKFAGDS